MDPRLFGMKGSGCSGMRRGFLLFVLSVWRSSATAPALEVSVERRIEAQFNGDSLSAKESAPTTTLNFDFGASRRRRLTGDDDDDDYVDDDDDGAVIFGTATVACEVQFKGGQARAGLSEKRPVVGVGCPSSCGYGVPSTLPSPYECASDDQASPCPDDPECHESYEDSCYACESCNYERLTGRQTASCGVDVDETTHVGSGCGFVALKGHDDFNYLDLNIVDLFRKIELTVETHIDESNNKSCGVRVPLVCEPSVSEINAQRFNVACEFVSFLPKNAYEAIAINEITESPIILERSLCPAPTAPPAGPPVAIGLASAFPTPSPTFLTPVPTFLTPAPSSNRRRFT